MTKQPNIVFILTDDQGYGDLGCSGNTIVQTPNIDALHKESTRLTNFHVGPTCAPTRAGLMTGHYANSTGVWHTIGGRSLLRENEWTLASALKEAGYRTGIFGKWHLGDDYPYRPHDRGFEVAIVHGGGGISQTSDYWGNDYFDDTYFKNGVPKKYHGYCTDVFFSEAKTFITEHKDEPFFCYIATNAPHGPYNVEDKYADKYRPYTNEQRARFYGMIENIDDNIALLRQHLSSLGLEEDTILIFMTDNGTSCGVHTDDDHFVIDGYNCGMRGMKCSQYEGGHRVPFFIHWPKGCIKENTDLDDMTANVDFMPTILDLCNVSVTKERLFHGISLKPLLTGKEQDLSDRIIVTDSQRVTTPVKWRKSSVCSKKWRLIDGEELYDIDNDLEQRNDISADHPKIVEHLRNAYGEWWKLVSSDFDKPIPLHIPIDDTVITCMDLINPMAETAWHQGQVRKGLRCAGYYEITIEQSGTYRFELRRWPKEVDLPITSAITGLDIEFSKEHIHEKAWFIYSGSNAIDIGYASIKIQGQKYETTVTNNDTCAFFEISLEKGFTTLEALFIAKQGDFTLSPYYIYVSQQTDK